MLSNARCSTQPPEVALSWARATSSAWVEHEAGDRRQQAQELSDRHFYSERREGMKAGTQPHF